MVWWNPTTWGKDEPPPTENKPQDVYFGEPPKSPLALSGTYVTPSGSVSAGGISISGSSGGISRTGGEVGGSSSGSVSQPTDASYSASIEASGSAEIGSEENLPKLSNVQHNLPVPIQAGETAVGGGLYYVTPEEKVKIGKTTKPVWVVQSPNTYEGMMNAIEKESRWAGSVQVSNTKTILGGKGEILSSGQYESNLAQIKRAQEGLQLELAFEREIKTTSEAFYENPESFKNVSEYKEVETDEGTLYELGGEYFKTLPSYKAIESYNLKDFKGYLGEARKEFYTLPLGTRISSKLGDLEIGTKQVGVGLLEFGRDVGVTLYSNFAVRTDTEEEIIGDITGFKKIKETFTESQLKFGKEIMQTPVSQPLTPPDEFLGYTKEVLTETSGFVVQTIPMALGAYFAGSASYGDFINTSKMIQPIRIKGGIFLPNFEKEFVNLGKGGAKTFEISTGKEAIAYTYAKTKGEGVILENVQYSKIGDSFSTSKYYTEVTTPYSYIDPYGKLVVLEGRTTIPSTGIYKSTPTMPQGFYQIEGVSITKVFGKPTFNYLDLKTAGVTTGRVGGIETFRYASGGLGTKFTKTGGVYYAESGFMPKFYGTGLRLSFKGGEEIGSGVNIFKGGGTKTPFAKTFGQDISTITAQTYQPPIVTGIENIKSIQISEGSVLPIFAVDVKPLQKTEIDSSLGLTSLSSLKSPTKTREKEWGLYTTSPISITKSTTNTIQGVMPIFAQSPITKQKQLLTQEQTTHITSPITPSIVTPYIPTIGFGFFIPPFPKGELGAPTTKIYSGKGVYRYTPSYEAFVLGIHGKQPKGIETGARIRPITPKFSFFKGSKGFGILPFSSSFGGFSGFKMPSYKRRKKKR